MRALMIVTARNGLALYSGPVTRGSELSAKWQIAYKGELFVKLSDFVADTGDWVQVLSPILGPMWLYNDGRNEGYEVVR